MDPFTLNKAELFDHLVEAVENQNKDEILDFIELMEQDINYQDEDGNTILHIACHDPSLSSTIVMLINEFSSLIHINLQNHEGQTILMLAAGSGLLAVVHILYELYETPFDYSIDELHIDAMDRSIKDERGRNAAMYACKHGHVKILRKMLKVDCDLCYVADDQGHNGFMLAARGGHLKIFKELYKKDVPVDKCCSINDATLQGNTALHYACQIGHEDIVRYILDYNCVRIDLRNHEGVTPLMLAIMKHRDPIVKLLLRHGASTSICTHKGLSVVDIARRVGYSIPQVTYRV